TYPPFGTRVGFGGVYYNGDLFLASYSGTRSFVKYDLSVNSWSSLPDLPVNANYGFAMVDGGDGYIYVNFGGGNRDLYRFSEANGSQSRAQMPLGINHVQGGLSRIGSSLYALVGNNSPYLMRYDIDTDTWITLDTKT